MPEKRIVILAPIFSHEHDPQPSKSYSLSDLGALYVVVMSRDSLQQGKAILSVVTTKRNIFAVGVKVLVFSPTRRHR